MESDFNVNILDIITSHSMVQYSASSCIYDYNLAKSVIKGIFLYIPLVGHWYGTFSEIGALARC